MIRILLVEDHPAMRTGLTAVLDAEPGLIPLATAASGADLEAAFRRTKPDVVLLDYHLPDTDGLILCRRLKREIPTPAVLLYSAYADAQLAIPAILAGADGLLHKSAPAPELYESIRRVSRGDKVMPPVPRELLDAASAAIDPEDLPVLGLVLGDTPLQDIADALRREPADILRRIDGMLTRLRVNVAAPIG